MTIDWGKLEHAYGEATNVPRMLEAIDSPDRGVREGAMYDFYGCLCHQGTVYTATVAAIPSLVRSATAPKHPARLDVLKFLADVAHGYGDSAGDVRKAIADAAPALLDHFRRADPLERRAILRIVDLAECAKIGPELANLVGQTSDPAVRAAGWLALANVDPSALPASFDGEPAVVLAWRLARLASGKPEGDAVAALLASGWPQLKAWIVDESDGQSPLLFCEGHVRGKLLEALCVLLENETDDDHAMTLYDLLLDACFETRSEDRRREDPIAFTSFTPDQRRVAEAIARSDAAWAYGNLGCSLMTHGLESSLEHEEFCKALGIELPVEAVIVTPSQADAAKEIAVEHGRDAWIDVPFIFMSRSNERLGDAIPEDPADFPDAVMHDARAIAKALLEKIVRHTLTVETWAFYPKHAPEELARIAKSCGFELRTPDLEHAHEPIDEEEGAPAMEIPPCVPYPELTSEIKERLATFARELDAAGWSEVKQSFEAAKTLGEAGIQMTPLAIARRFGDRTNVEIGFHAERDDDELLVYIRLTLVPREEPVAIHLRLDLGEAFEALATALATIDCNQDETAIVGSIALHTPRILAEVGGELQPLE